VIISGKAMNESGTEEKRVTPQCETMNCFAKDQALASLNQAGRNLLEILSDGTELDEDDQLYIQCHLRLMDLTYSIWKNGPIES